MSITKSALHKSTLDKWYRSLDRRDTVAIRPEQSPFRQLCSDLVMINVPVEYYPKGVFIAGFDENNVTIVTPAGEAIVLTHADIGTGRVIEFEHMSVLVTVHVELDVGVVAPEDINDNALYIGFDRMVKYRCEDQVYTQRTLNEVVYPIQPRTA